MTVSADEGRAADLEGKPESQPRTVYIDSDMVLLAAHQGRCGIELDIQADVAQGIERLSVVVGQTVILVYPLNSSSPRTNDAARLKVLHDGLGATLDGLLVVGCPHDDQSCQCAEPGSGLIELAMSQHRLPRQGWFIGADQEGVVSARGAGLNTIRIGPVGMDHLSAVHRPDYEARDLLDAANHILVKELS